jgi:hypothetical protein
LIAFRGLSAIVNAMSDRPQVQFSNGSNPFEPTLFKPVSTRRWPVDFSETRPFHDMPTALRKSKILAVSRTGILNRLIRAEVQQKWRLASRPGWFFVLR